MPPPRRAWFWAKVQLRNRGAEVPSTVATAPPPQTESPVEFPWKRQLTTVGEASWPARPPPIRASLPAMLQRSIRGEEEKRLMPPPADQPRATLAVIRHSVIRGEAQLQWIPPPDPSPPRPAMLCVTVTRVIVGEEFS